MPETDAPGESPDKKVLTVRGFSAGTLLKLTLLKLTLLGSFFSVGLVILGGGVLALFGVEVLSYNGEHVTGWPGLGLALVMAPVVSALIALPAWAGLALGVWMVTRFRHLAVAYLPS